MRRTVLTIATAATVATAGMLAASQPANAVVWWVAPAIIGGVVLGGAVGASAAAANTPRAYAYEPQVTVRPVCHTERIVTDTGRLRRVRVCD